MGHDEKNDYHTPLLNKIVIDMPVYTVHDVFNKKENDGYASQCEDCGNKLEENELVSYVMPRAGVDWGVPKFVCETCGKSYPKTVKDEM